MESGLGIRRDALSDSRNLHGGPQPLIARFVVRQLITIAFDRLLDL